MSQPNRLICITINGYRKPGLSDAELHHYLCEVHAPMAKPFLEKYGILEYNVIDNFAACRPHAEYLQMSKKLSDHDYIVQFVMKDVEDFRRVWDDPEFRKNVMPDHENFADTTRSGVCIGYVNSFLNGGRDAEGRWKD
ncbi:EthD domain-containing protein [Aspergillus avenaceus]|uniref:EthD domain-containing protein n=1 Tax=Aspergillus avenaceus TaxID=36643 RepID=A0A5N6TSX0_ASPAV|nr:EthD domain-containing protein [Aspergillus avenaceus]